MFLMRQSNREQFVRYRIGLAASAAFHAIMVAALVWISALPRLVPPPQESPSSPVLVVVTDRAAKPDAEPGLRLEDGTGNGEADIAISQVERTLTIQRLKFDTQKITERAKRLFPFLTPGLALEDFAPSLTRNARSHPSLGKPKGPADLEADRALEMTESERQALIDRVWSRRRRWQAFQPIVAIVERYGASVGDLPALLQMYRDQDGLQIYADPDIRDHRLWASLEIAADHVDFINFIHDFINTHPSSKASTELLFLLDLIAQSSLVNLSTLLSVDPARELLATRRQDLAAYDLVVGLQRYYQQQLARKQLDTPNAVRSYYDATRLALLDIIVRSTPNGYREGDALYLTGQIYWSQGNRELASEAWLRIRRDTTDTHQTAYTEILEALRASESRMDERATTAIDRIQANEQGRWRSESYDRLSQFGFHFDTY